MFGDVSEGVIIVGASFRRKTLDGRCGVEKKLDTRNCPVTLALPMVSEVSLTFLEFVL